MPTFNLSEAEINSLSDYMLSAYLDSEPFVFLVVGDVAKLAGFRG